MTNLPDALLLLADILEEHDLAAALIGGQAVNAWAEPRFTADINVTIAADAAGIAAVRQALLGHGNLIAVPELDWDYIQEWAEAWEVADRLATLRAAAPA